MLVIGSKEQKMKCAIRDAEELVSWRDKKRQLEFDIAQMKLDAEREGFEREFKDAERKAHTFDQDIQWARDIL